MARIFLSYRSLDRGPATALEGTVTQAGHRVFLDCLPEGGISAGDGWEHRLYDELYRSDVLVALVSASYVQSQWCFAELAIARARGLFILPVALEAGLRHPLLANVQHLDVGGDPSASGERLLSRLRELEGISAIGWSSDRPLYAGLEPFDVEDSAVFFGRSQETASLLEIVVSSTTHARRQPVFVTGASGCGKSSIVRAGLIPALRRRGGWLSVPPMIPGESPVDALALAVARGFKDRGAADFDSVSQRLREEPSRLWRGLAAASTENAHGILISPTSSRLSEDAAVAPGSAIQGRPLTHWFDRVSEQKASSSDGRLRLLENPVRLLDTETGIERPVPTPGSLRAAAFSANGSWLAICGYTWVALFDPSSCTEVARVGTHDDEEGDTYCAVGVTNDGKLLVAGTHAGTRSAIWKAETGERIATPGGIRVAIEPSGGFALAGRYGAARLTSIGEGPVDVPLLEGVTPVFTAPGGDGPGDGTWQPATLGPAGSSSDVPTLGFSSDGAWAAVGTSHWTAVCDVPSGEPVFAWAVPGVALGFSIDGRTLAARARERTVLLSIPAADDLLKRARGLVTGTASAEERARFGL